MYLLTERNWSSSALLATPMEHLKSTDTAHHKTAASMLKGPQSNYRCSTSGLSQIVNTRDLSTVHDRSSGAKVCSASGTALPAASRSDPISCGCSLGLRQGSWRGTGYKLSNAHTCRHSCVDSRHYAVRASRSANMLKLAEPY